MIDNRPDLPWKEGGQRAIDFVAKHGGNPVWNATAHQYWLPTGARMTLDGRGLAEPPANPHQRRFARRLYLRLLIAPARPSTWANLPPRLAGRL